MQTNVKKKRKKKVAQTQAHTKRDVSQQQSIGPRPPVCQASGEDVIDDDRSAILPPSLVRVIASASPAVLYCRHRQLWLTAGGLTSAVSPQHQGLRHTLGLGQWAEHLGGRERPRDKLRMWQELYGVQSISMIQIVSTQLLTSIN